MLGVVSHVVLDIIQHEPDIYLLPVAWGPRLGLGLALHPLTDLVVELAYGIVCWRVYRGSMGLVAGIVGFNLLDSPLMFRNPRGAQALGEHPAVLTTVILVQILATWGLIAWLAKGRSRPAQAAA